jgi:hypothetical protein
MISFRTNDPTQPEGAIAIVVPKIHGGFLARPASVAFASVPIHARVSQTVDLYDAESPPRAVGAISCNRPDLFHFHVLPLSDQDRGKQDEDKRTLVARLEVVPVTAQSGYFEGDLSVSIATESRQGAVIPLLGRVTPVVEVTPSSLVLPRRSGAGPIYFGSCVCRSTTGQPLTVTVDTAPAGIGVQLTRAKSNPTLVFVRIEWLPGKEEEPAAAVARHVRLRSKTGGGEATLDVPIYLTQKESVGGLEGPIPVLMRNP